MSELVELTYNFILEGLRTYGFVVWCLALLGLFAILSAIGNKVFQALKYLFMIFVAIPSILIVGLINKSNRKERLKELGEIKVHLKQNPEKWKRALYYFLWCLFILFIVLILYYFAKKFFFPFVYLNEFSKQLLQNVTDNSSS